MTVYIVQEVVGRNLVPAQKYGELVPLLPAKTNLMLSTGPEVSMLKRKLVNFNDDDYLLLIGDPAAIGICCAVAASINNRFSVLKWDRQEMTYYSVTFDLRGNATDLGELHV
tara:strand:+ start:3506 stop:3841 length:336 start_codon:yes stop_codon:yes gene_type:complete